MRELCVRCRRSIATCFCPQIEAFDVNFDLVLLQHPNERRSTVTTARMTHLFVRGSRIIEGASFASHAQVDALLADPTRHCVVLYPGPTSVDVGTPEWRVPAGKRLLVFVLDGTWSTAAKMLRMSPNLQALPQIRFTPTRESEYGFKKQPRAECLSTLEAVHDLLEALEPAANRDGLLRLFRNLVQEQLRFAGRAPRTTRTSV
jgi:DTW domain-containing protein YfiP